MHDLLLAGAAPEHSWDALFHHSAADTVTKLLHAHHVETQHHGMPGTWFSDVIRPHGHRTVVSFADKKQEFRDGMREIDELQKPGLKREKFAYGAIKEALKPLEDAGRLSASDASQGNGTEKLRASDASQGNESHHAHAKAEGSGTVDHEDHNRLNVKGKDAEATAGKEKEHDKDDEDDDADEDEVEKEAEEEDDAAQSLEEEKAASEALAEHPEALKSLSKLTNDLESNKSPSLDDLQNAMDKAKINENDSKSAIKALSEMDTLNKALDQTSGRLYNRYLLMAMNNAMNEVGHTGQFLGKHGKGSAQVMPEILDIGTKPKGKLKEADLKIISEAEENMKDALGKSKDLAEKSRLGTRTVTESSMGFLQFAYLSRLVDTTPRQHNRAIHNFL